MTHLKIKESIVLLSLILLIACGGGNDEKKVVKLGGISPANQTINLGETITLNVTEVENTEVEWKTTGGTLTPAADGKSATFTSDTPNTYTITATAKADTSISKTTVVTVKPAEPTIAIKSGETATVEQKKTLQFEVEVLFPVGQPENLPTWTVVEADCGSVAPVEGMTTTYTAPTTPKTCTVTASIVNANNETIDAQTTITVTGPEEIAGMVYVEPGTFTMGCDVGGEWGSTQCQSTAQPAHEVKLTKPYYIGKTEVTQAEWKALMDGDNPSYYTGDDNLPVDSVTWDDIQIFISKLNERDAGTGRTWRLPTEAEWEYAARGGVQGTGLTGCGYNAQDPNLDFIWSSENSDGRPHPVGTKLPNELGLYDMCGNMTELVADWWGAYSNEAQIDPLGPEPDSRRRRTSRDASFSSLSTIQSVTFRSRVAEAGGGGGFRLACEITPVSASTAAPTFFESATKTASDLWDSAISNIKSLWNRVTK